MTTAGTTSDESYNMIAKLLHWLIAAMIVLQFVLANLAEEAEDAGSKFQQLVLLANHKSVGITILTLAIIRLAWRFFRPPPQPLPMPRWQRIASGISHWSLYALLILTPLSGWLMSSASAISVSWFNLFQLPDFVAANEGLEELFKETHELLVSLLGMLALLHIAAAIKHAVVNRDGAIRRISSPITHIIFVAVVVLGVFALTKIGRASEAPANGASAIQSGNTKQQVELLPQWKIDYSRSFIRFTAEQAGAEFEADWKEWRAEIRFDAAHLDASSFDVTVSTNSVATKDKDRDETLMDNEWFDEASYPTIIYRANDFSTSPVDHFTAEGEMLVKGVSGPVELIFSVQQSGERAVLEGNARLDRIALGIGTGDWEDTTWVGQFVDVQVRVEATVHN